jgi:hypothetical protein
VNASSLFRLRNEWNESSVKYSGVERSRIDTLSSDT